MKKSSTVMIASAVLSLPLGRIPALHAQQPLPEVAPAGLERSSSFLPLKFPALPDKWPAKTQIVGIDNGNTIYRNERGELFQLDVRTGDMVFLPAERFAQFSERAPRARSGTALRMVKWSPTKIFGQLIVLGVDQAGRVIHQNERGEKFFLDPVTADMVFVK